MNVFEQFLTTMLINNKVATLLFINCRNLQLLVPSLGLSGPALPLPQNSQRVARIFLDLALEEVALSELLHERINEGNRHHALDHGYSPGQDARVVPSLAPQLDLLPVPANSVLLLPDGTRRLEADLHKRSKRGLGEGGGGVQMQAHGATMCVAARGG